MLPKQLLLAVAVANMATLSGVVFADEEATELDKTIVSASMSSRGAALVPAFTTVIDSEDIVNSSVNSISDLLRETVGVNNFTDASGRDEIQIRGLGGEYTVLLIDGKRISSGGAFAKGSDADLNAVPLDMIERVEIIRGPMSALYGADAIGGVVNIITKKAADNQEFQTSINAGMRVFEEGEGTQNNISVGTYGALSDTLTLSASAASSNQDAWYADKTNKDVPQREEKNSNTASASLGIKVAENQHVDVDLGYTKDERPYGAYATGRYREQELERIDMAVSHNGAWDWGQTTAYIKHESSDVDDFNTSYPVNLHATGEDNTYAKAYANLQISNVALVAGVDYRNQVIKDKSAYLLTGEFDVTQYAAFAQGDIALSDDLTLTLGGRLDDHELFGDNFSPKAYLVYQLNDAVVLKGGVMTAFKAPEASKLSSEYSIISCGGGCVLSGDPDLQPEESVSYEMGVEVRKPTWDLSASIFHNDVDNLLDREIGYDPVTGAANSAKWINVNKAMTEGLELSGSYNLGASVLLKANYTYQDVESEDGDGNKTKVTNRPKEQSALSVAWQATNMLETTLSVNHVSGMYDGVDDLPSYYRADLGVVANVTQDLVIRGGIKNLEDVDLTEESEDYTTYELGRSYYLSAGYKF